MPTVIAIWDRAERQPLGGSNPLLFANSTDANAYLARKSMLQQVGGVHKQSAAKTFDLISVQVA
jgi:hypothetical protein